MRIVPFVYFIKITTYTSRENNMNNFMNNFIIYKQYLKIRIEIAK